jgi:hypothetical protein
MEKIHKKTTKINNLAKSQTTTMKSRNKNYTRVINTTNTQFTQEEILLLSKGLKYNLCYKQENWKEILSLEAETAISNLDITEQQYYRHTVVKAITRITQENKNNINNKKNKKEWELIIDIKNKVSTNKLTITKAGKGKTIVINKRNTTIK